MNHSFIRNEKFLRNIYAHGQFQGHGFLCNPIMTDIVKGPDYDYTISDKPVANWAPAVVENYRRQVEFQEAVGGDSVPLASLMTGTHLYAAAFGCEVHRYSDNAPCALPFIQSAADADRLTVPDIWKSPTLYRVFELGHAVQKELGKDVFLGPSDMQSGFSAAALIWNKTSLLCAMMDENEKEAVKRLAAKCALLFKTFLREFRKEFPRCSPCHCPFAWAPPEMGPWLSNDECGMFSPEMFEEFCLPELTDLAKTFGGLGMHCCADAEHQFESFKKIPHFYAFNRVAARHGYRPLLDYFTGNRAPVHVLAGISPEDTHFLIQNAPAETRFIFCLDKASLEDAKRWLETMRRLSPRTD